MYTIPELHAYISSLIGNVELAEHVKDDDVIRFSDQNEVDRKDSFLLLTGSWDQIHMMRYQLMSRGWVEGEHYLPVVEIV
ncbi:hypothetical protein D3C73_1468880 [compost metagenome]